MKYVVTGGAGFIGSHIAEALVEQGEWVIVLDNFSTGKRENLADFEDKIEIIEGSITDLDLLMKVFKGVDYVIHQAALPSVPRSIKEPLDTNETNITGTLNILLAALENRVKRVIYASSSSVYGDQAEGEAKIETMCPNPLSPYALSKLTAEEYCRIFHHIYGLETVSLRYFNVFGPHQDSNSAYAAVIPKFVSAALKGEAVHIYGDGKQSRDFTYVTNNVQANLLACTAPSEKVVGKVFNVACGETMNLLTLLDHIEAITRKSIERVFDSARKGDVKSSLANINAAQKGLKYSVEVKFEEGLRKTIDSLKKSH